jgi:hypothetical protein
MCGASECSLGPAAKRPDPFRNGCKYEHLQCYTRWDRPVGRQVLYSDTISADVP